MSSPLLQPPELWTSIVSLLCPADIARTARSSSWFLNLARPILYRSVHLRSHKQALKYTFALLKSDHAISHKIRELHLTGPWSHADGGDYLTFDVEILAGMSGLRSLTLSFSFPFDTVGGEHEFIRIVSNSCRQLKELTFHMGSSWREYRSETFELEGLERFAWNEKAWRGTSVEHYRILKKCRSTLTHLAIVLDVDNDGSIDACVPFSLSHFPNLISFEIGPYTDMIDESAEMTLVLFLIAHPLIEHLSLNFAQHYGMRVNLREDFITHDMLPSLRSLHASIDNIARFARRGMQSLRRLSKLYVDDVMDNDIDAMFDALIQFGGFPGLADLYFERGWELDDMEDEDEDTTEEVHDGEFHENEDEEREEHTGISQAHSVALSKIAQFAQFCPSLKQFTVVLPLMNPDEVAVFFSNFTSLTHIFLLNFDLDNTENTPEEYFSAIAARCLGLEEINFISDGSFEIRALIKAGAVLWVHTYLRQFPDWLEHPEKRRRSNYTNILFEQW